MIPFKWFTGTVSDSVNSVIAQGQLIKQIQFPKIVLPVVTNGAGLVNLGFGMLVLGIVVLFAYRDHITSLILAVPFIAAIQFVLMLALSMFLSALTVFYRDIGIVVGHLLRLLFYVAPILWTFNSTTGRGEVLHEKLGDSGFQILRYNPIAVLSEAYRTAIYGMPSVVGKGWHRRDPGAAGRPLAAVGPGPLAGAADPGHHRVQAGRTGLREGALGMAQGVMAASTTPGEPDPDAERSSRWPGRDSPSSTDRSRCRSTIGRGVQPSLHQEDQAADQLRQYPAIARRASGSSGPCEGASFTVRRGESIGVIGPNGAGKSTLLLVLAGIITPSEGQVEVDGHISTLLSLSAGFDQELSGYDNIALAGALMGIPHETVQQITPEVVEFADIGAFIDAPLKTYSSGMRARLGFAIATAVDPDILLLDEVLQTGDEVFREKSRQRIISILTAAKAVVLVTHDMTWVTEFCTRAITHRGRPGDPRRQPRGGRPDPPRTLGCTARGTAGADRADAPGGDRHHRVRGTADGGAREERQARRREVTMRVLIIPAQSNPYQTLLADALRAQGVRVTLGEGPSRHPVAPLLLAWIRAGMPRVIHLHWVHRYLKAIRGRRRWAARRTLWELRILRRLGVRIVWTLHNIGDHDRHRDKLEMLFHRQLVELCDAVICHCAATRRLAIEAYGLPPEMQDRLHVVPHGNYLGWYPDTLGKAEARSMLGLGGPERVFLFMGQIRRYKGVEDLLEAFQRLDAPDARLIVAGRADRERTGERIALAAAGDARVTVALGEVPDDRMQVYLRAADAVVLPYTDVLTSGSAILAMTFGRPVIAPAIGCLPESLGSDGTILYDPVAPGGLEGALRLALETDLTLLGERAAAHAATLSWDPIAARTAELYQGAVTGD